MQPTKLHRKPPGGIEAVEEAPVGVVEGEQISSALQERSMGGDSCVHTLLADSPLNTVLAWLILALLEAECRT